MPSEDNAMYLAMYTSTSSGSISIAALHDSSASFEAGRHTAKVEYTCHGCKV